MNPEIEQAITELTKLFPDSEVQASADGQGGAHVRVAPLRFGEQYTLKSGWVVFHILHTYPHADIYGHYLPPAFTRSDGRPLGEGFHLNREFTLGPFSGNSTFVSRKSNRWDASRDTAAVKLQMVLDWIRNRS